MERFDFTVFPDLTTTRLFLRKIEHEMADALFALRSDPTLMKYIDRAVVTDKKEIHEMIDKMHDLAEKGQGISWGIYLHDDPSNLIGYIGYYRTQPQHFRAEVGYMLATMYQQKGFMWEAMVAVLNYGFHSMNLHSVEAVINPANTASQKLLEKAGFQQEAYFRENYFFDGKFLDSAVYSLLKREFKF